MANQENTTKEYLKLIWDCFINFRAKEVSITLINIMVELSKNRVEDLITAMNGKNSETAIRKHGDKFKDNILRFLWELTFEQDISKKLKELAIGILAKSINTKEYKRDCIAIVGKNFLSSVNIEASIYFLMTINFVDEFADAKEAENFILNNKLIDSAMKTCVEYHDKIRNYLKKSGNVKNSKAESAFIEHASLYLSFLKAICPVSAKCSLHRTHLNTLWSLYFKSSALGGYEDLLWNALKKENRQKCLGFFSSAGEAKLFFEDYLLNPACFPLQTITLNAFACFRKYFELVDGVNPVSYTHLTLPTNREV
eukprot:TRINITY_DN22533_c0_g1_i1.p1 TRINITY_DN22533_c0_g1~~TRINITY_DN22533_c0_g1_i1.p1  ORF type:complete len:337 (+),score=75.38 TRINITY_DN22533_c0_g1_i1:81-1013(+)